MHTFVLNLGQFFSRCPTSRQPRHIKCPAKLWVSGGLDDSAAESNAGVLTGVFWSPRFFFSFFLGTSGINFSLETALNFGVFSWGASSMASSCFLFLAFFSLTGSFTVDGLLSFAVVVSVASSASEKESHLASEGRVKMRYSCFVITPTDHLTILLALLN